MQARQLTCDGILLLLLRMLFALYYGNLISKNGRTYH